MSLKMGKNYSNRFLALWALIKAVILPFQGNSSLPPIFDKRRNTCYMNMN